MSERPIQVGDLVQVIKWPCCGKYVGYIRRVEGFTTLAKASCSICLTPGPLANADLSAQGRAPIEWLKRIPPIEELESTNTDTPIKEPA